jgi:hypothetical protein
MLSYSDYKIYIGICFLGVLRIYEYLSHDSGSLDRNSNRVLPEHRLESLLPILSCLVSSH